MILFDSIDTELNTREMIMFDSIMWMTFPSLRKKTEINDTRFDPKKGKGEKALNVEGKEGGKEGGQEGGRHTVFVRRTKRDQGSNL